MAKTTYCYGRCFADEGDLLLFDEPLASLDPAAGAAAMALIDELQQERNMTVVVIEHRIEDVLRAHVDRVIVMAHGRIVANDTPTAIIQAGVLSANGLDEPLYIQLLRRAGVPVNKIPHVADVEKVDVSNFRDQIETLAEPVQTVTHDDKQLLVQNLTFAYDQQEPLFENLSTSIHEGEILGIVGKNGSGKTTLSHLLTGFLTPSGGDIQLDGRSLLSDSIKERADHIGYVLQNPNHMITKATVFDEVASGLRLRNIDEEQVTERVRNVTTCRS